MAEEVLLCCHVKTWTWVVAIVNVIQIILTVFGGAGALTQTKDTAQTIETGVYMGIMVLWVIFVGMLIFALCKNRANFIIPHMVVSFCIGLYTVFQIIMGLVSGVASFVMFIGWGLNIVIILFFLAVEYKCYTWMKDYEVVTSTY